MKNHNARLNASNASSGFLILLVLTLLLVPDAKALAIEGLMKIGLFQPDLSKSKALEHTVPDIVFKDSKGKLVSLADLRGKVVFVNFWATWCPPCRAEMPSVEKLYQKSKGSDVIFLLVEVDNDPGKAQKFMNKKGYNMPVYSMAGEIPGDLFRGSIPTTFILDKYGKVAFLHEGTADYSSDKVYSFLQELTK